MHQPGKPTFGSISTKIITRRDALDVADSIIPMEESDECDPVVVLATRSVLREAIWSLHTTWPNNWSLGDLRKITSNIGALRNILANTLEGRFVSSQLLPVDAPEFCSTIVETINFCLH